MIKLMLQEELTGLKNEISTVSVNLTRILENMCSLIIKVDKLEIENIALKKELESLKANANADDVIEEVLDRERRQKNVIIYNLPESTHASGDIRNNYDGELVGNIIRHLEIDCKPIKMFRLTAQQGKRRPLKVILESRDQVLSIFKNKSKLKNVPDFSDVSITGDLTSMQRAEFRRVRDELQLRRNNGESELYIRYLNNRPTIGRRSMKRAASSPIQNSSKK